jgi:hypothetical protein
VGQPYPIGDGVTLLPPDTARVDAAKTRPGRDRGTALFLIGQIRLAVVVAPYRGSLDGAADRLHAKLRRTEDASVGPDRAVRTSQDVAGLGGTYAAGGRCGTYAVFVAGSRSVEVTASGPEADLRALAPQVDRAIRSIRFSSPARGP